MAAKVKLVSWPDQRFTRHVLLCTAWLIFAYMFLLTMFELIELLRPRCRSTRLPT